MFIAWMIPWNEFENEVMWIIYFATKYPEKLLSCCNAGLDVLSDNADVENLGYE